MTEPIRTDCKPPLARLIWPALPCPALPCPALPCPALPCPALLLSHAPRSIHLLVPTRSWPCLAACPRLGFTTAFAFAFSLSVSRSFSPSAAAKSPIAKAWFAPIRAIVLAGCRLLMHAVPGFLLPLVTQQPSLQLALHDMTPRRLLPRSAACPSSPSYRRATSTPPPPPPSPCPGLLGLSFFG